MPDTNSILTFFGWDWSHHQRRFNIPLTFLDWVLGLDLINRFLGSSLLQQFDIPNLDGVILTATHEDISLSGMPIKVHRTIGMSMKLKSGHILLPNIPYTQLTIPLTRCYIPRVVWIKFDAFNLSPIILNNTLLVVDGKDFYFAVIRTTYELARVFRIPV